MLWKSSLALPAPSSPRPAVLLYALSADLEALLPVTVLDMDLEEDPTCLWLALAVNESTYVLNVKPEQHVVELMTPSGAVGYCQPLEPGWADAFKAHFIRLIVGMGLCKLQPVA
jgi:hypothetical protein